MEMHNQEEAKTGMTQRPQRTLLFIIVISVLLILFCFVGAVGLANYRYQWDNALVNAVIRVFPFPAAVVNGEIITYYEWREEVKAVKHLAAAQNYTDITDEKIRRDVLDKLIQDVIIRDLARRFGVKVNAEDMEKRIEEISSDPQVGGRENFAKQVQDLFNWDLADFQTHVLYVDMLGEKLYREVPLSEASLSKIRERAEDVLRQVRQGDKSFEELAAEYSDDSASAQQGGSLGWAARDTYVKEFADAAFALQPGETSDLVKTQFGYHIIKLDDKRTVQRASVDADGNPLAEDAEEINARHILIKSQTFKELFDEERSAAKVREFVK